MSTTKMERKKIRTVGIIVKRNNSSALSTANELSTWLRSRGIERIAEPITDLEQAQFEKLPANADLIVVLGGDGTMLATARIVRDPNLLVLGVNYGGLGYLTEIRIEEMFTALEAVLAGEFKIDRREMLEAELWRGGELIDQGRVLNDVVINKAALARIIEIEVRLNGSFVNSFRSDGLIVATPTGSTAYNLSAGGPIVDPKLDALILSAITPHTLNTRSLVFGPDSVIDIRIETRGDAVLSCDGSHRLAVLSGDKVRIVRQSVRTNLVCVDEHDFLTKLGDRLLGARHTGADA